MAEVAHEKIETKYKLGDVTSKGTVSCVMASRHKQGSKYIVDGKIMHEWEIDDLSKPTYESLRMGTPEEVAAYDAEKQAERDQIMAALNDEAVNE